MLHVDHSRHAQSPGSSLPGTRVAAHGKRAAPLLARFLLTAQGAGASGLFSQPRVRHGAGPLPRAYVTYLQFEQLCLPKSFFLSLKQGNNCILARGKVGIIRNILSPSENSHERVLIVENFRNLNNFYTEPLPSSDLRIFQVGHLSGDIVAVNMNEVSCKCVLLPYRNSFVSVPLIHSFVLQ